MKGKRGRPPVAYPVRGCLMTVRQIAEEFGLDPWTVSAYRYRHPNPDGTPMTMQAVYEHYMRVREGRERRFPGRTPRAYPLPDGRRLTVAQMARELGMRTNSLRRACRLEGCTATEAYLRRVQKKEHQAVKAIVAVWMEAGRNDP